MFKMSERSSSWDFNRSSQQVSTNTNKINQNVVQLQKMIAQIGTNTDSIELRDKLHQLQHYTNQLSKETSQKLIEVINLPNVTSASEQRMRKMHKDRLMNDFTMALSNFQLAQRQEKDKEALANNRPGNYDPFEDNKEVEENGDSGLMRAEDEMDVQLLEEREKSMCQLEADIMDVNQIFKELALLVHQQNDVVDSIEANVESAAMNVEHGVERLHKARNYQLRNRRRKFCIAAFASAIFFLFFIVLFLAVTH